MAQIIDGKTTAAELRTRMAGDAAKCEKALGRPAHLAVILVEGDPASEIYVRNKKRACEEVGITSTVIRLSAETSEETLLSCIDKLNDDETVDGILVQLPLPQSINTQAVIEQIDPAKDVDGFHPVNAGRLATGMPAVIPCTPRAVMELIHRTGISPEGKKAVIVGRSNIVGKPLAQLLLGENATVTICHSKTPDLEAACRDADILIAAVGSPALISRAHVKRGAVVIDVGISRGADGLCGDVDYEAVSEVAGFVTPVPGGVGPMTIAMLLRNTLDCCLRSAANR